MDLYNELEEIQELEEKIIAQLPANITFDEIISAVNSNKSEEYNLTDELINLVEDYVGWYLEIERELAEVQNKFYGLRW